MAARQAMDLESTQFPSQAIGEGEVFLEPAIRNYVYISEPAGG